MSIVATEFYCKILDHLPRIPQDLLESDEFELAKTRPHGLDFPAHSGYINRPDGATSAPRVSSSVISESLIKWIHSYIRPKLASETLIFRQTDVVEASNFYPPHIDTSRKFVLLYNLSDSGGDLVFWQEKNQPIFRELVKGSVKDYGSLQELYRVYTPPNSWYIANTQVIHSVENLTKVRQTIQIDCSETDNIVVDYLKPLV